MFDVFQNVLFGKKKNSSDTEKDKTSESDEFVVVGQAANANRDNSMNQNERFPKNPYTAHFATTGEEPLMPYNILMPTKSEEKYSHIMPLQDVPFSINASLYATTKLEQIWRTVAPCLDSVDGFSSFQDNYDFSLEKSVISEMTDK